MRPRLLVVGCGSIGRRHTDSLVALDTAEVLVCDTDAARAAGLAERHSLKAFTSLREALGADPAAALICTPNHTHLPLALQAARAGCHLFIEKPVSHTLDGIEALRDVTRRRGLTVLVACNMRFHPSVAWLRRRIQEGAVGRVLSIHSEFGHYLPNWRPSTDYRQAYSARRGEGGGIVLDAIHELDYLMWFLGDMAHAYCLATKVSDLEIETEDTAKIILRSRSGVPASVHLDYTQRLKRRRCEVVGSEGTLIWESRGKAPEASTCEWFSARTGAWEVVRDEVDTDREYVEEMRHFLRCLEGREEPLQDLDQGEKVLRVALAAKRSAEAGSAEAL